MSNLGTIHAGRALTSFGWQQNVSIDIGEDGLIENLRLETSTTDAQTRVDVLLPAPSNLHSHAFQRAMAGLTEARGEYPSDSFWTWRKLMYRFLDNLNPDDVESIAAQVQLEMLQAGYAAVGEFHYLHHQSDGGHYNNIAQMSESICAAANDTGIGLTLLPVLYEHGGCDGRALGAGQRRFGNNVDEFSRLFDAAASLLKSLPDDTRLGVAPHSLRAVSQEALKYAVGLSPDNPVHMHLAEQVLEVKEIEAAWGARPVAWLLENHAVDERWCLIHCTQMLFSETQALAKTGAVAGLCPITESSLGDGIFDGRAYLASSGRIGFGSDSNLRISLSEELRTLEYSQRLRDRARAVLATDTASTGRVLFNAAASGGAQACKRNAGSIEIGKLADLVALDTHSPLMVGLENDDILDGFIFAANDSVVSDVWSAGRHLVRDGFHINHQRIKDRYINTILSLKQRI